MKRMKLKWIGLNIKYPLILHPISIGEVDEDKTRRRWREEDKTKGYHSREATT
jgi:hypothetical protein